MSIFATMQAGGLAQLAAVSGETVTYSDATLGAPISVPGAIVGNEATEDALDEGNRPQVVRVREVTLPRSLVASPQLRGRVTYQSQDWALTRIVSQDPTRTVVRIERKALQEKSAANSAARTNFR